jgi:preprotein translocase subunit SecD
LIAVLFGVIALGTQFSDAQWTPKLALDLEGGTEIVLAPVPVEGRSGDISESSLKQAVDIIRQRVNGNGVSEAEINTLGSDNIVVSLPGKPDPETINLVKQSAELRFRSVLGVQSTQTEPTASPTGSPSSSPSTSPSETVSPSAGATDTAEPSPSTTNSSNPRAVPQGLLKQATVTPAGDSVKPSANPTGPVSASPSASPATTPTDASDTAWVDDALLKKFEALDCSKKENLQGGGGDDPDKPMVACEVDGTAKYVLGPAEVLGKDVKDASAAPETNSQGMISGTGWQVNLEFSTSGAKKFGDVTSRLAKLTDARNQFAIVLDGLVVSAPQTNEAITGGNAQITGNFTQDSAQTLANQLKFGALPVSFKVQTEQQISATLGGEQLQRGLLAGLIGLLLVVLYSLLQYRALGAVTIFSLVASAVITYGMVIFLGWRMGYRLSLPGIAGLVVAIGVTADSFIVFFERVRDEMRDGRNLSAAVEAAWVRARRTILASDTVNLLAAMVLYLLAIGGVQGFAFTLGLTTVVDVIVVFLFTKPMVALLARTRFFGGGHKLSGFDPERLGRTVIYAGRGRLRTESGAQRGSRPQSEDGGRRMTIAERREAERAARPKEGPGDGDDADHALSVAGDQATSSRRDS